MEAAHVLRRSQARLLCASTDVLGTDLVGLLEDVGELPDLERRWSSTGPGRADAVPWDAFIARADGSEPADRCPGSGADDLADIIFTSGTTGAPKGAMLAHGPSVRTYEAWSDAVGLHQGDRYLCVYPFFHTAGLKSAILACVLKGATVLPHAVFDPAVVMERVSAERITVLPGPPTVFQSMLEHPDRSRYDLSIAAPLGHRRGDRAGGGRPAHARRPEDRHRGHRVRTDRDDGHGRACAGTTIRPR